MKNPLIIVFFCLPFLASAQKRKLVTERTAAGDKEIYYVIKGTDIKDGPYIYQTSKGVPQIIGTYKQGERDSVWTYYQNGYLYEKGRYSNDLREGIWITNGGYRREEYTNGTKSHLIMCFDDKGDSVQLYNDSSKKAVWVINKCCLPSDTAHFPIIIGGDTQKVIVDRPPLYAGGNVEFSAFLQSTVKYPPIEKDKGQSGVVYVEMVIDTSGELQNILIKKSATPGFDKEALRVLKLTSGQWIPAMYEGRKVTSIVIQPVRFQLI